jgi:hypothetical protein
VDGKIKEIRDYHHAVPAKAAQEASAGARPWIALPRVGRKMFRDSLN